MTNHHLISDSRGHVDKNGKPFRFNCEPCQFRTNKVCNYTTHMKCDKHLHTVNGTKPETIYHYCQHCPYKSIRRYSVKVHTMTQHEKEKPVQDFTCEICNVGYNCIENLKNHLETQQHIKKQVRCLLKKKQQLDIERNQQFQHQAISVY